MSTVMAHRIGFSDYHPPPADFYGEVIDGLSRDPKCIPPKFFYDAEGSLLFDAICGLPEYYQTRTELALLREHAAEILRLAGRGCVLVEPGSGSSTKVRVLLDVLKPCAYIPMDISREHLIRSAQDLYADYPWLHVHAACADFTLPLDLPECPMDASRLAFFPGSSIGNFEPAGAVDFLVNLGRMLGEGSALLIGVDLKKDEAVLNRAYNDSAGVTEAFNLNLLARINRELDGTFDVTGFRHHAFYNSAPGRIEMHLISRRRQWVRVAGQEFDFAEGESIHTENSYKYSIAEFQALAQRAGYVPRQVWVDPRQLFSLHYLRWRGDPPANGGHGRKP